MATVEEALLALVVAVLKVVIAFLVGIGAIYLGFRLFDRWTKGIDELSELKKGNLAVGLLIAAIVLAYTNVIGSGVDQVTNGVLAGTLRERIYNLIGGLLNLAIAVSVASLTIRYALGVFSKVARGVEYEGELRNRNVAVGLLLAGIIFGLSQVTARGVNEIGGGIGQLLSALFG